MKFMLTVMHTVAYHSLYGVVWSLQIAAVKLDRQALPGLLAVG